MRNWRSTSWRSACLLVMPALLFFVGACGADEDGVESHGYDGDPAKKEEIENALTVQDTLGLSRAIFAGGCFWCEETAFEGVQGVHSVVSGFVGGQEANPSYKDVSSGKTGHTEAVLVTFDPEVIPYSSLLEIFWVNHDPTTNQGQFCDRGRQYRPGIFYLNDNQKRLAESSVAWARQHLLVDTPIVTEITRSTAFWPAEEYHQDFFKKNPVEYNRYRTGCGRDARLAELWGSATTRH